MTFGEELCRLLDERGMSQRELARRSHYDSGFINKLCRNVKPATPKVAARLDKILDADGALVALVNRRAVLTGAAALASTPLLGALELDGRERLAWVQRHPPQIDQAVVDSLAGVLAAQRRAEDSVGPRVVMRPVLAQLAEIEELVRQARGPVRPALVDVAQQWAQYGAYLYRDVGNPVGDRALLSQALEWAAEIGDRTMTATVFVQRGNMALAAGEIGTVIGLAQAAQRDTTVSIWERACGAHLEARGYAHSKDALAAERKLDDASDLFGRLDKARDVRPWLYWMSPQIFQAERGVVLGLLADDPRYQGRAIEALTNGYTHLPDDQKSSAWAARNLVHLASVHARAGNVGQALTVAMQGAEIARLTGSMRLRGMLVQLHDEIAVRCPQNARVDELAEALR